MANGKCQFRRTRDIVYPGIYGVVSLFGVLDTLIWDLNDHQNAKVNLNWN